MVDFKKIADDKAKAKSVSEQTADAIKAPTGFDPSSLKVLRRVTYPLLKWTVGQPRYVQILAPIYRGKQIKADKSKDEAVKEPADLMNVRNLEDNREYQVIVGTVLKGNLIEAYPEDAYVGKFFMLTQSDKRAGKDYKEYEIIEIEAPSSLPTK